MYEQKEVKEMDELLYQYMPIVDEILCKNVPGSMNHEFSERFEKRMNINKIHAYYHIEYLLLLINKRHLYEGILK